MLCGCPTGTEGEARPVGEAASRPWRRRRLYASEQRSGKPLTPRGHFQFKAELGKKERAPILIGALWLPNGHGGRSAPGGRSSEPSVAQASALRKRTAKRKAANAKRAFSVQSRVGKKRKSTYFHRCSVVAQRGFEPRQTESESVVLPLHNWAISKVPYYYSRLAPKCQ